MHLFASLSRLLDRGEMAIEMTRRTRTIPVAAVGLGISMWACGAGSPSTPAGSTTPVSTPVTISAITPSVKTISPNVGSTGGGTSVTITGSGLLHGVTVTFDGVTVAARFDSRYIDRIFVATPPHAAGTLDVVVTNPGGQPGRLEGGYTYAPPLSFDFNGAWSGYPNDGTDVAVEFTIQNDALVRVSCDPAILTFPVPVPVTNGAFSFSQDGVLMSGKIVSADQAVGAIKLGVCNSPQWEAERSR
jgi:hypothetical protein